jgi:DNA-binding GntR family transcriptional regulator
MSGLAKRSGQAPLPRVTLAAQIAERLRADILSGSLTPNLQLNEKILALEFGVSRGPLRESMQGLIQEGLLRNEPHRGVFVSALEEDDLIDVYVVRRALESAAVERIVNEGERVSVSRALHDIAEKMDKAVRGHRWKQGGELDFLFHRALVDAANSKRLSRMFATVQAETQLCLHRLMGGYRSTEDLAAEHFELAELLATAPLPLVLQKLNQHLADPVEALQRVRQHITSQETER